MAISSAQVRRWCSICLISAFMVSCDTAPVTERRQLILLPESQDTALGLQSYQQILSKSKISKDSELNRRVREVGLRIAAVSANPEFEWEFTVIEDPSPNAFALPGGKVGVHTGLFKVAQNDAQLAAVMAHEVGHAVARHGAERISRQMLIQGGLAGVGIAAGAKAGGNAGLYVQLASAAATLGIVLPFSRSQESEADRIGVNYMAKAGYDPRQSINLWQNFASAGGDRPPEFLSTHPSPGTRIDRLKSLMPEAMEIYRANQRQARQ